MIQPADPFDVACCGHTLRGDRLRAVNGVEAVYLHGAGQSSRATALPTRQLFQQHGIGTIAVDCIGHGDTGGDLTNSSLQSRTAQAAALIEAQHHTRALAIIGSSMGGYDAIKLTERLDVAALVLIVPAVYTPLAWNIPFGPEFSKAIRAPGSWEQSDAWQILSRFRGRLLVIAAADDHVIPQEIPERMIACATAAVRRKLLIPPGTSHARVFAAIRENPALMAAVMEEIRVTVAGGSPA